MSGPGGGIALLLKDWDDAIHDFFVVRCDSFTTSSA